MVYQGGNVEPRLRASPGEAALPGAEGTFMLAEIFKNEFYAVMVDGSDRRLEMVRSSKPFESRAELLKTSEALLSAVARARANDFSLVLDSRAAPSASEGKYKDAFFTMARMLTSRFSKVAVILSSQEAIEKVRPDSRPEVEFFTDLAAARKHVSSGR